MDTSKTGTEQNNILAQRSYAAVDMLIQQSGSNITQNMPLEIGVLRDLDEPGEITNFGKIVTEQIASRFVQLGYNVTDSETPMMSAPKDGAIKHAQSEHGHTQRSSITGRYAIARQGVLINLRIVENVSGKVLAAYDYTVPYNPNIRELTKTQEEKESFFSF